MKGSLSRRWQNTPEQRRALLRAAIREIRERRLPLHEKLILMAHLKWRHRIPRVPRRRPNASRDQGLTRGPSPTGSDPCHLALGPSLAYSAPRWCRVLLRRAFEALAEIVVRRLRCRPASGVACHDRRPRHERIIIGGAEEDHHAPAPANGRRRPFAFAVAEPRAETLPLPPTSSRCPLSRARRCSSAPRRGRTSRRFRRSLSPKSIRPSAAPRRLRWS